MRSCASQNAHYSKDKKEEGHDTCPKPKVDKADIKCFKTGDFPSAKHDKGEREEEEHGLFGGYIAVVAHTVHYVINTYSTTQGRVKTKYEKEFQILSSNTMTKEEAVMIQDVDALPAVRAVMRPQRNMEITAQAVLVSFPKEGFHAAFLDVLAGLVLVVTVPLSPSVVHGGVLVHIAGVVVCGNWYKGSVSQKLNPV